VSGRRRRRRRKETRPRQTRGPLPDPLFATILADAPWGYENYGQAKHGAARAKYPGSPAEFLGSIPVWEWGRPDCNLFHWVTFPKIEEGIDVMRAWGFRVVTAVPWIKTVPAQGDIKQGIGHWGFGAAELLLLCRRGYAKAPRYRNPSQKPMLLLCGPRENPVFYRKDLHKELSDDGLTSLAAPAFYCKLGPHSRKPLSLFEWIESYFPGRYLELFARGSRPGWTCVGHESAPQRWHLCEEGPVLLEEAIERGLVAA